MNILFICDEYPPGLNGGIGSITQVLARALTQKGHQVFVAGMYTYAYGGKQYEEDEGVKVWRLRYGFNFKQANFFYKVQRKLPVWLKNLLYARQDFNRFLTFLNNLIDEHKIDVIEQPDWNTFMYDLGVPEPVFPKLKVPLIVKSHGSHTYFSKELNVKPKPFWEKIDRMLYERADALCSVSNYTAHQNYSLFHPTKSIKTLYNTIDFKRNKAGMLREQNLVFFSGTLVHKKGVFSLIEAWNTVISHKPDAKLVVFGKGDIAKLKDMLNEESRNTVSFMGHQPRPILADCLQKATMAVFPSYTEAFALGPMEAMSTGCPTIYTKLSSGPELITDHEDGLLVDPHQPEEVAQAILLLFQDDALRARLGMQGAEKIFRNFNFEQTVQNHVLFYEEVIENFRRTEQNP
jgi:glycosyltransferase involved in cell wall biosynthesis